MILEATYLVILLIVVLLWNSLTHWALSLRKLIRRIRLSSSHLEDATNELVNLLILFPLLLLLLFFFWNPEVNEKRFRTKISWFVELLDGSLSRLDTVIEDVGNLVRRRFYTFNLALCGSHLDWYDSWVLDWAEYSPKLLFSDIVGDELDKDVRIKCCCEVLSDRVDSWTMLRLVVLLAYMSVDDQENVSDLLLVHNLDGLLCVVWIFEANITIVSLISFFISMNKCWVNLSDLGEESL